jgi:hypothetical protein
MKKCKPIFHGKRYFAAPQTLSDARQTRAKGDSKLHTLVSAPPLPIADADDAEWLVYDNGVLAELTVYFEDCRA